MTGFTSRVCSPDTEEERPSNMRRQHYLELRELIREKMLPIILERESLTSGKQRTSKITPNTEFHGVLCPLLTATMDKLELDSTKISLLELWVLPLESCYTPTTLYDWQLRDELKRSGCMSLRDKVF